MLSERRNDNRRALRIAMVAPPYFTVPPDGYGGVEAVVADLVDALVDRGHHVTLIGAGRHGTKAQRFFSTYDQPPSHGLGQTLPEVVHAAHAARIVDGLTVDLVHDHTLAGPLLARGRSCPTIVTAHGPVDGEPGLYYQALDDCLELVAISEAQRAKAPHLPWVATVANAIRVESFPFNDRKEEFALFLGRFHPEKAPHLALEAARAAQLSIVLAGKCAEPIEREYFAREIEPRLGPDVVVFGPADALEKRDLLARARCLLFPVLWDEPFGLVMTEAMACGTPVVALRRGSVPEVVVDGHTGIIVDHPNQLAGAVARAASIDPAECRRHVEENFSIEGMAAGYEVAYRRALRRARRMRTFSGHSSGARIVPLPPLALGGSDN